MYPRGKRRKKRRTGWSTSAPRWVHSELEFITKNYRTMLVRDIAAHLGRSYHAVITRAKMIGVWKIRVREWTPREERFLKKYYPTRGCRYVAQELKRDEASVASKANLLDVYSRVSTRWKNTSHNKTIALRQALRKQAYIADHVWTRRELEYVKLRAPHVTVRMLALEMKIYYPLVQLKLQELGLGRAPKVWSPEEEALLRSLAPTMDAPHIAKRLRRSVHAVRVHAERMKVLLDKVVPITPEQKRFVLRNYKSMQYKQMAEHTGLKAERIKKFLNKDNGLRRDVYPKYTKKDFQIIKRWYHKKEAAQIGDMIGHSRQGVIRMASILGLNHTRDPKWTREEEAYLRKWYPRKQTEEIAKTLHRKWSAIGCKARLMGLRKMRGKYLPYSRQQKK